MSVVGSNLSFSYHIYLSIQHLVQPVHRIQHDVALAHRLLLRRLLPRAGRFDNAMDLLNGAV
jgi:hypothetical protein